MKRVVVDHHEGIAKPTISTEGFQRFPCFLLVALPRPPASG